MRTRLIRSLFFSSLLLAAGPAPLTFAGPITLQQINNNFNPADCAGAKNGACPVIFAGDKKGRVYLTIVYYKPNLIPNPGQMLTLDLGYDISPGGSLIECLGATTPGRSGKCNGGGSPANNNVGGVLTFPAKSMNIYFFTGDMEKNFTTQGGFGQQPSYVQYGTLYSEMQIATPNLGIGTTPVMISTPGVSGYFRSIQSGKNERLFLIEPVPESPTGLLTCIGLAFSGIALAWVKIRNGA